jgi:hypothetical protein
MEMNMEDELFFSTKDLGLAATISLTVPIEKMNKENPKRVFFVFNNTPEVKEIVEKYFLGGSLVDPHRFMEQLRNLKAAIYAK